MDVVSDEGLADLMAEITRDTPVVLWERGPHPTVDGQNVLALSADGSAKALSEVTEIFDLPKQVGSWCAWSGVPPKAWEGHFIAHLPGFRSVSCESAQWRWIPLRQKEACKPLSLQIWASEVEGLNDVDLRDVFNIALFGEVGEQNVADFVESTVLGKGAPPSAALPFIDLRRHLIEKVPQAHYREIIASLGGRNHDACRQPASKAEVST